MLAQAVNNWGSTPEQVGLWLACCGAILGMGVLVVVGMNNYRQWSKPAKRRRTADERFVTRLELKHEIVPLCSRVIELERRCNDFHSALTANTIANAGQKEEMRKMIDLALDPVEKKLDKLMNSMAHVTAKLKVETCDEDC